MPKKIYCSLDIEGTGLDPKKDAIIEVGAVLFTIDKNDEIVFGEEFSQLIKPPIPIPPFIQDLTGIREKDVAESPAWEEVLPKFKKFVGTHVIVGQNIPFDLAFLSSAGLPFEQKFIDTKPLAQTFVPNARFFNLEYLMRYFGKPLTSHHRALDDAKNTALLLSMIIRSFHALSPKLQSQVAGLLAQSVAAYKALILPIDQARPLALPALEEEGKTAEPRQASLFEAQSKTSKISSADFEAKLDEAFAAGSSAFINTGLNASDELLVSAAADYIGRRKGGCVLSVEFLGDNPVNLPKPWLVLDDPQNLICEVRLRELLAAGVKHSGLLMEFLVKVLIFQEATGSKNLKSLSLFGEDYNFRELICADFAACKQHSHRPDCSLNAFFYGLKSGSKIFTTHAAWLKHCRESLGSKFDSLCFFNPSALESAAERNAAFTLNPKRLRFLLSALYNPSENSGLLAGAAKDIRSDLAQALEDIDLHFGLWGIEVAKYAPGSSQYLCDEQYRNGEVFERISQSGANFIDRLEKLLARLTIVKQPAVTAWLIDKLSQSVEFLKEFMFQPKADRVYWFDIFSNTLKLKSQQRFAGLSAVADFNQAIVVGDLQAVLARQYFGRTLDLEDADMFDASITRRQIILGVASDLPIKDTPHAGKALLRLLENFLPELTGRTIVLVNSQKNLDSFFESLEHSSLKPRLLVQRYTGHNWKNTESYAKDTRAVWFMTVKNLLSNLSRIPPTENLVFLRLPYDAPGILSALYDQDSVFEEFVLPRTAIRLQQIFKRMIFKPAGSNTGVEQSLRRVIILDPRLLLDYNSRLLSAIESEFDCERVEFEADGWESLLEG